MVFLHHKLNIADIAKKKFGNSKTTSIPNSFEIAISYVGYRKNAKIDEDNTHPNHAACCEGIGCEITMFAIPNIINESTLKCKKSCFTLICLD